MKKSFKYNYFLNFYCYFSNLLFQLFHFLISFFNFVVITLTNICSILNTYNSISLNEASEVKLIDRIDTKYLVSIDKIVEIFDELKENYNVLEINQQRIGKYSSIYYDTADFQMFHSHITQRFPRFKVRERIYSQNGLQFFELKKKLFNDRTIKKRLQINENQEDRKNTEDKNELFDLADEILLNNSPFKSDELQPILVNDFERVTLIDKAKTERLTLDFNLKFKSYDGKKETPTFENVVIIELKQNKRTFSTINQIFRRENIKSSGMSKYCVGMFLLNNHFSYKLYKENFTNFLKISKTNLKQI
jgi:hypothetical protein